MTETASYNLGYMARLAKRMTYSRDDRAIVDIVTRLAVVGPRKILVRTMWETN